MKHEAYLKSLFFVLLLAIAKTYTMLRIILTFIIIYLIFRIVLFFIIPRLGQWYLNRHRNKFYRNNPNAANAQQRPQKNDMHISDQKKHNEARTDQIGEYVDFEEINSDDD